MVSESWEIGSFFFSLSLSMATIEFVDLDLVWIKLNDCKLISWDGLLAIGDFFLIAVDNFVILNGLEGFLNDSNDSKHL